MLLVYADGRVCISILHSPGDDPTGYESSSERWSPVQSVEKILLSVLSMLAGMFSISSYSHVVDKIYRLTICVVIAEPNDESAANVDAAKCWRDDKPRFLECAQRAVRKSLGIPDF